MTGQISFTLATCTALAFTRSVAYAQEPTPMYSESPQSISPLHSPMVKKCDECLYWTLGYFFLKALFDPYGRTSHWGDSGGAGYPISGPQSANGQLFQAIAFALTKPGKAQEIDVGLGYVSGTNGVNIGLYSDAGGLPGKELASGDVTGIPAAGSCCTYMTIKFSKVALAAGTQYWVVLSTDDTNADAVVSVYDNTTDEIDTLPMAYNTGGGWTSYTSLPMWNFAVRK